MFSLPRQFLEIVGQRSYLSRGLDIPREERYPSDKVSADVRFNAGVDASAFKADDNQLSDFLFNGHVWDEAVHFFLG